MDIQTVHTQVNFLSSEQKKDFVKAMKIGYFKTFFKQGLISAEQLEYLIKLQQDAPINNAA
ncbi:MAG: hypothetical protein NC253_08855 [Ruminococcus sp.]|nr:hypothetical protein [Ruminococcus sp.]MCM1380508.1 hypothetical protein [Muribaculaceae bacterium]MCM1478876.1 hypothetical protein [Muribaculaceae bacterium]